MFAFPADRRFAADTLARYLRSGAHVGILPNVGALARIQVPVETIDRQRNLVTFRERLEASREQPRKRREPPRMMPLFTPTDLATLKPSVVVRTMPEFRSTVLWCGVALIVRVSSRVSGLAVARRDRAIASCSRSRICWPASGSW